MLNTNIPLQKQQYTGLPAEIRAKQKQISRSGEIACFKLNDIENNKTYNSPKSKKSQWVNSNPEDEDNTLIMPDATWETINHEAIKYKKSINSSKYKTEFLQFYKDGVLIKIPGLKKMNYLY